MEITIREISGKKALKKYVQFNIDLYKENPYAVPPLIFTPDTPPAHGQSPERRSVYRTFRTIFVGQEGRHPGSPVQDGNNDTDHAIPAPRHSGHVAHHAGAEILQRQKDLYSAGHHDELRLRPHHRPLLRRTVSRGSGRGRFRRKQLVVPGPDNRSGSMDLMAASTRRVGVSITTMASRTSVILPIVWAALFLGERITGWELLGTALVMLAFVFIIYRPHDKGTDTATGRNERLKTVLLPVGVFLSVGFIAVCMKTSQHLIKTEGCYETDYPVFEIMLFSAAFLGAVAYYAAKEGREAFRFRWKSIAGGLCLGTFNYFVTFGLMHGLKYFSSSTFYGIYNISVVLLTTLVGIAAFGEKLDGRKTVGMLFAVASIFVLGFLGGSL